MPLQQATTGEGGGILASEEPQVPLPENGHVVQANSHGMQLTKSNPSTLLDVNGLVPHWLWVVQALVAGETIGLGDNIKQHCSCCQYFLLMFLLTV